ncbi:FAD/NAD(P)-binding protein [Hymenobacter humi]|uniref:FAD/NAD(P)-binding protein n=1 Tax=Hymenobacter humi TaxID=1411620 RepID=A0ABW2U5Q3_9BACT
MARHAGRGRPLLTEGGRAVQLADGTVIKSDYVVLALGNFSPPPPAGPDLAYLTHPGYHADPWVAGNLRRIGPDEDVLLIGSGLTSVDVLLALRQDGHRAPITVVARHGRWPAAHGPISEPYPNFYPEPGPRNHRNGRSCRGEAAPARRHGPRRRLAAGARLPATRPGPHLGGLAAGGAAPISAAPGQPLGRGPAPQPPQNAEAIEALTAAGMVKMQVGTVREILPEGEKLRVRVRPHGTAGCWHTAHHVVCCAGPLLDYGRIADPLVVSLREAGDLTPDSLGLGLLTDEQGALRRRSGTLAPALFTLGPSRRPAYFESTAVPELRQQAAALAVEPGPAGWPITG